MREQQECLCKTPFVSTTIVVVGAITARDSVNKKKKNTFSENVKHTFDNWRCGK